jgi:hypothetical protein
MVDSMITVNKASLDKATKSLKRDINRFTKDVIQTFTYNEKRILKNRIASISFSGDLFDSVRAVTSSKQGRLMFSSEEYTKQANVLEGDLSDYPQTYYLGAAGNYRLQAWAEVKLGKSTGKLVIGGRNTSFGAPTHKILTNSKAGRKARLDRLIKSKLTNIK